MRFSDEEGRNRLSGAT